MRYIFLIIYVTKVAVAVMSSGRDRPEHGFQLTSWDKVVSVWRLPFDREWARVTTESGAKTYKKVAVGLPKLGPYKELLDSVFYLYRDANDAEVGAPSGATGFLISMRSKDFPDRYHSYAVTNWHVAVQGGLSTIRLPTNDGRVAVIEKGPEDWEFIPSEHDLAITPLEICDHYRIHTIDCDLFLTEEQEGREDIGPGDDVLMIGRFVNYDGGQTNRPSIRFGHISMSHVPVEYSNGKILDSFILDMNSRTGFSGSPIFVYRTAGSIFDHDGNRVEVVGSAKMWLLGIHCRQFPEDMQAKSGHGTPIHIKGLSGMTAICPASEILKILQLPKLEELRMAHEREHWKNMDHTKPMDEVALSEDEIADRRDRALSCALNTPPKADADKKPGDGETD